MSFIDIPVSERIAAIVCGLAVIMRKTLTMFNPAVTLPLGVSAIWSISLNDSIKPDISHRARSIRSPLT
ncbi:MAG: hypothetical protein Ct9H300mP27_08290 [Chloroflexota bacterium]|nr:MAG: hypothetical protein Ct9H300mP27_08290 [Chloroflexota bacterium]